MNKKEITITVLLSIATTVTTIALWAGGTSTQQRINTENIASLQNDLKDETNERKTENTQVMVKLAEISTNVLYIKEIIKKD